VRKTGFGRSAMAASSYRSALAQHSRFPKRKCVTAHAWLVEVVQCANTIEPHGAVHGTFVDPLEVANRWFDGGRSSGYSDDHQLKSVLRSLFKLCNLCVDQITISPVFMPGLLTRVLDR
jgi:hypothetical protein